MLNPKTYPGQEICSSASVHTPWDWRQMKPQGPPQSPSPAAFCPERSVSRPGSHPKSASGAWSQDIRPAQLCWHKPWLKHS